MECSVSCLKAWFSRIQTFITRYIAVDMQGSLNNVLRLKMMPLTNKDYTPSEMCHHNVNVEK